MRITILLIAILLSGCAASGGPFRSASTETTKATIIVYRLEPLSLTSYTVAVNGMDICSLHREAYFVYYVDPGLTTLSTSSWSMPGTSKISLQTKSGKSYFIRLTHNTYNSIAAGIGGLVGQAAYQEASDNHGPMSFIKKNPEDANNELKETSEDCVNN